MNRKLSFLFLCALLIVFTGACAVLAEDAALSMNASVIAPYSTFITAPFSGTLLPFSISAGDIVQAGESLFELDTIKVYAPVSGTLTALFASPGDDASALVARYGALAVIEPENPLYIAATTQDAYDDEQNKYLHAGETLYLKRNSEKGTGRVVSVSADTYIVEILSGNYNPGESIKCYRNSNFDSDSVTGSGKARRYEDTTVTATGRILRVHKAQGEPVSAGDLLFELIDATSAPGTVTTIVTAHVQGAVRSLSVAPGSQVYQGQLLCEIADLSRLELSVQLDEVALSFVKEGDSLSYELDAYPGETLQGTVTQIRPLGEIRQNAAYYDVRVTLPGGRAYLPGMNATVTIAP